MIVRKSHFLVSLDFELMWGVRDKRSIVSYGKNILGARAAIPDILQLFKRYNIHATWAVVGLLFAKNKSEMYEFTPSCLPTYENNLFDPYKYLEAQVGHCENSDPYHFASSLIDKISHTDNQEIASHTYSHFYCLEPGQTPQQFEQDIISSLGIAKKYGHKIESIIFPRNQFSDQYLRICKKNNIAYFRGNPESYLYQEKAQQERSHLFRGLRAIDTLLPLDGYHGYAAVNFDRMINVPASRFLRPISSSMPSFITEFMLSRIIKEMEFAAKNGLNYHLWWHPHNFGSELELNINYLSRILDKFKDLNCKYGMESQCMRDIDVNVYITQ